MSNKQFTILLIVIVVGFLWMNKTKVDPIVSSVIQGSAATPVIFVAEQPTQVQQVQPTQGLPTVWADLVAQTEQAGTPTPQPSLNEFLGLPEGDSAFVNTPSE